MMMMSRSALLLSSALGLAAGVPAAAQTVAPAASANALPATETGTADDIIVTAQKREQILVDVPQSVTVVGGAALERQQATSFQDYLKLVPGLQLNQSTPGQGRLVIRGVNTGGVASTVAVYVDETPFGSSSGLVNGSILAGDFDTFDIARIEVLRGPQGTLYGASSLSGVLKFVTNAPSTEKLEVRGRATIETVEDGDMSYSGAAVVNIPISDKIAIRGTGYYRKLGGFIDSIGTAGSDIDNNINGSRSYGGRISALLLPTENLTLRFSAALQNLDTDASSFVESDPTSLKSLYGGLTQSKFVPTFTDLRYRVYNGTADLDLGFATLTSSTSYATLDNRLRSDLTSQFSALLESIGFGPNEFLQQQETNYTKFTQELRLASAPSDRFEWLAGAYYTREKGEILQDLIAVVPGTLTPIAGLPLLGAVELRSKYRELAAFANGTIKFGERFDVTLGGRYSDNRQRAQQVQDGLFAPAADFPEGRSSEDVFTYSVAPKFKINERTAIYARVAKGFRPGGPNVIPPGAPADAPASYASDSVVSYEVGFKGETADRSFGIDVSAFHIDWKNIQLFAQFGNFGLNANGGKAAVDGVELTATVRPTAGLVLSANGAFTHAGLKDDTPALVGGFDGDRLPFTPKTSISVNGDYEWALSGSANAFVGASLRFLSEQPGAFDLGFVTTNGRQRELPAYEVVDLRAGVTFGRFSLEAFAKNLTNSAGRTSTGDVGTAPNGALPTGVIRPRTIGLTLGAGF